MDESAPKQALPGTNAPNDIGSSPTGTTHLGSSGGRRGRVALACQRCKRRKQRVCGVPFSPGQRIVHRLCILLLGSYADCNGSATEPSRLARAARRPMCTVSTSVSSGPGTRVENHCKPPPSRRNTGMTNTPIQIHQCFGGADRVP
jgi:hypothetical protein